MTENTSPKQLTQAHSHIKNNVPETLVITASSKKGGQGWTVLKVTVTVIKTC